MEFLPGDIQIRSEQNGKTIWVGERLIIEKCSISDNYIRLSRTRYKNFLSPSQQNFDILPDNGTSWRWAKMNGTFYYAYDRIPNRAPKFYRDQLPSRDELLEMVSQQQAATKSEFNNRIREEIIRRVDEFFHNEDIQFFRYSAVPAFNPEKSVQLAQAKAWCCMIQKYTEGGRFKRIGINRKEDFYEFCTSIISDLNLEGLKIKKAKSLRKKIHYFPSFGTDEQRNYLISEKYGNDNRRIVGKFKVIDPETGEIMNFDLHESIMYDLWMNPGNPQKPLKVDLYQDYQSEIKRYALDSISESTFTHYLSRFGTRVMLSRERDGKSNFDKKYTPYVPAGTVKYANSIWAADGSGLKLFYKYFDKNGKCLRGTLYGVRIVDVSTGVFLGISVGEEESTALVREAVEMAVRVSGNYGCVEFLSDNGSAFSSAEGKELTTQICLKRRWITVGNSQANPSEMYVKWLSNKARRYSNWIALGMKAHHIDNKPNPDYLPKNEELPTRNQAVDQFYALVKEWNSTRLDAYYNNFNPKLEKLREQTLRYMFGHRTKKEIEGSRGILKLEHAGQVFKFEIPDYHELIHTITKATNNVMRPVVPIIWDENGADIYSIDGRYLVTCNPSRIASKESYEQTTEQGEILGHHLKRKAKFIFAAETITTQVINSRDAARRMLTNDEMASDYGWDQADTSINSVKEANNSKNLQRFEQIMRGETTDFDSDSDKWNNLSDDEITNQAKQRIDRDFDATEWP